MAKVVYVYTKPNCDQCKMVKKYLNKKNIPFIEINIINKETGEYDKNIVEFLKGQGIPDPPAIFYGETDKNNGLLLEDATKFTGNNQNELKKLVKFFE